MTTTTPRVSDDERDETEVLSRPAQSAHVARSLRACEAVPTWTSAVPDDTDISVALEGSRLLGLPLFDQGVRVARLLEARHLDGALFPDVVVEMPRRATKTTSIWATILGRAATRPGYRCVTTAQTGTTASRILLDHAEMMLAQGHAVESSERGADLPRVFRNGGREHLDFPNHSRIWVVPPDPGAVRSAAADDIVIDEAGEQDPAKFEALMRGVQPLMDTRGARAQMIVAGTPGRVRQGPFWALLEQGRNGVRDDLGVLDYSIRDSEDAEDRNIWRRVHPGPSSLLPTGRALTPMEVLEKRRRDLGSVAFGIEYLCRWPFDSAVRAIDSLAWKAREVDGLVLPERFAIGYDCAPDGSAAAIAAAWRVAGVPHVALVDYRPGVSWVAREVRNHRATRVPVAADFISSNNVAIADDLRRARPMIEVTPPSFKRLQAASQAWVDDLPVHQAQPDLERAVEAAVWRESEGGRLFGRKASGTDISPLVAGLVALWCYDQTPERRSVSVITV